MHDPELILGRWARFVCTLLNARSDKLDPDIAAGVPREPTAHALGTEPTVQKGKVASRSMANANAVGLNQFSEDRLRIGLHHDLVVLGSYAGIMYD